MAWKFSFDVLREHNRIVGKIKEQYPTIGEEELFQIGRRLVIAEMQNIVYGEYLPLILGKILEHLKEKTFMLYF